MISKLVPPFFYFVKTIDDYQEGDLTRKHLKGLRYELFLKKTLQSQIRQVSARTLYSIQYTVLSQNDASRIQALTAVAQTDSVTRTKASIWVWMCE